MKEFTIEEARAAIDPVELGHIRSRLYNESEFIDEASPTLSEADWVIFIITSSLMTCGFRRTPAAPKHTQPTFPC